MKVLITGSAGRIGRVLIEALRSRFDFRGFDRIPTPGLEDSRVGDLRILEDLIEASTGAEVIVHLAGDPRPTAPWNDVLNHNIVGTYNVFEAARRNNVRRVIFASRAGFFAAYPVSTLRTVDLMPRPENLYSVGKIFGEFLGQHYAYSHRLEVIAVRVGNFSRDRHEAEHPHHLSHRDCVRLFERCISYPNVKFEIVFGVSDSTYELYDLDHGRRVLDFHPLDRSDWRPSVISRLLPEYTQQLLRKAVRLILPSRIRSRLRSYWLNAKP